MQNENHSFSIRVFGVAFYKKRRLDTVTRPPQKQFRGGRKNIKAKNQKVKVISIRRTHVKQ